MTLSPDERHAVADELRWLADHRESGAVLSPSWLRRRAVWVETSGERRGPARERDAFEQVGGWVQTPPPKYPKSSRYEAGKLPEHDYDDDALDSIVLRWGEPR